MKGKEIIHIKTSGITNRVLCKKGKAANNEQVLNYRRQYLKSCRSEFSHKEPSSFF